MGVAATCRRLHLVDDNHADAVGESSDPERPLPRRRIGELTEKEPHIRIVGVGVATPLELGKRGEA